MLAISDNALDVIRDLVNQPQVPEGAGLRIAATPAVDEEVSLEVTLASVPAEDDEVVQEDGAQVFLEPQAADLLEDKQLDAHVEGEQVAFTISEQTS